MIIETNAKAKTTIGDICSGHVFQFENDWYMVVYIEDGWNTLENDHDRFFMASAYCPIKPSDKITTYDDVTSAVRLTDGEVYYFKNSWEVQECGEAKVSITISK